MIGRLFEFVRCGMAINVVKTQVFRIFKAAIPSTGYDRSKTTGECGLFQLFV